MARVILGEGKARPFWYGHGWVFSGSVDRVNGRVEDGDVVDVVDSTGKLIGRGFWDARSMLRVRMLTLGPEPAVDAELIRSRLERAVALRRRILGLETVTDAFRIVHAEGDGLPGLVADRLGSFIVLQFSTAGILRFRDVIVETLRAAFSPAGIWERLPDIPDDVLPGRVPGVLAGAEPSAETEVREHGLRFTCDVKGGQKTGFYTDQRDNRQIVASLAEGRDVLDTFSYVGAFALHALKRGRARSALAVDSSAPALAHAEESARRNAIRGFATERRNVLRFLDEAAKAGRRFDLVIADPPKLVRKMADLRSGLRTYFEINRKALAVVSADGLLATSSCSQHVTETAFFDMLSGAAKAAGRRLQILHRGSQGPDHPVILPHEESRYLKFIVARAL